MHTSRWPIVVFDMAAFKTSTYLAALLTLITLFLGIIALRPMLRPAPVFADSEFNFLYVEPKTTLLRNPDGSQQVEGKVMIDMRNGDIWGFPTLSATGYPVDTLNTKPPVSDPIYLGRFNFAKMSAVRERANKR
jgi:hypothetical protein